MVRENKNDGENISSRISRRKEMVNIDAWNNLLSQNLSLYMLLLN
jgi:hypothetical protein